MTYHTVLGFCTWDIPAAIILVAVLVFMIIRVRGMKKKYEDLEAQLDEAMGNSDIVAEAAEKAVPLDD